jgi:hypothetical protein
MEAVAEHGVSVVLSSHLVADLERVCDYLVVLVASRVRVAGEVSGFLLLVPAIIGTFWAAPLLTREFEAGTFQLAWTQSVTRTRWLAAKLGVGALAAMATAGLFSLLLTWWSGPIDTASPFDTGNSITFLRLGFVLFPLPARQPLLGPPVVRNRDLPRRRAAPGRVLLLVDPVAPSQPLTAETGHHDRNEIQLP